MPARLVVETFTKEGNSDLGEALSFCLDNTGDADAEISFDASGAWAPLPSNSARNFHFMGDRYFGKLYVRFTPALATAEVPQSQKVTLVKTVFFCL